MYHLDDFGGHIPPGRLLHAEEQPDGTVDVFLHPLHVREELAWELNWINCQQVGMGHWRQRWLNSPHSGRMHDPTEGLDVCLSRWEIIPQARMPKNRHVFPVEKERSAIWLIRSGSCTTAMRDAMNVMLSRIAGDGLWVQNWEDWRGTILVGRPACGPSSVPVCL
ncbi:hypothetical protein ACIGMX_34350 [Streptomyces aquilus]|uniref:hypothetical protein n=1 Tax=Streptomyces aquilus TaxID=2548456 RepID=UPI0037D132E8